jgi:hypothetical protein
MVRSSIDPPAPPAGNDERHERGYYRWANPIAALALFVSCIAAALSGFLVWMTYENNIVSQRAYVMMRNLVPLPIGLNNAVIGHIVVPQWENVGNTYAADMTYRSNFQFSRDDLPNGFSVNEGGAKIEGPTSLGPREVLNTGTFRDTDGNPFYFPQSCMNDLFQGKYRYTYIWGWAKYKDFFRPGEERITRYCWRIFGTLVVKGDFQFNHYLCDEGNCQDATCEKYKHMHAPRLPPAETCQLQIPIGAATPPVPPASPPVQDVPK